MRGGGRDGRMKRGDEGDEVGWRVGLRGADEGGYIMEKVEGTKDARKEETRIGGSSLLRFRGREGCGRQQAREGRGGSVS